MEPPHPAPLAASVVVVGAGPSGLACADALAAAAAAPAGVLVLEAAPRVGGRTRSVALASAPGVRVDLGGQWLGSRQSALRALAAELGLATHVQHCAGRRVLDLGRVVSTYAGLIPSASLAVLVDAQLTLWLLALLQLLLRCAEACFRCGCCGRGGRGGRGGGCGGALARALDAISVEQLARRCMWTAGGRALVAVVVLGLFGRETSELSALALCRYAAASGGLEEMSESGPGSVQESSFVGGAQQVSELLAARAEARGARVLLGHVVVSIERVAGGGVIVTCANGARVRCDRVVVAVPPPIAQAIAFAPALSAERAALMRGATMGGIIKVLVVYRTAFWREKGFSGEVICDTNADPANLPVFNVFDGCTPRPSGDGLVPLLTCFVNGARARELSAWTAAERRRVILVQLARYFGDEAMDPLEVVEHDWVADPFTRGCPIASYGRAVLSSFGVARRLLEHDPAWGDELLWAGTETAEVSTGFIDGAVRAGLRAAGEVAEAQERARSGGAASASRAGNTAGAPRRDAAGPLARHLLAPQVSA
jgi:monoamine oxidase